MPINNPRNQMTHHFSTYWREKNEDIFFAKSWLFKHQKVLRSWSCHKRVNGSVLEKIASLKENRISSLIFYPTNLYLSIDGCMERKSFPQQKAHQFHSQRETFPFVLLSLSVTKINFEIPWSKNFPCGWNAMLTSSGLRSKLRRHIIVLLSRIKHASNFNQSYFSPFIHSDFKRGVRSFRDVSSKC